MPGAGRSLEYSLGSRGGWPLGLHRGSGGQGKGIRARALGGKGGWGKTTECSAILEHVVWLRVGSLLREVSLGCPWALASLFLCLMRFPALSTAAGPTALPQGEK